MTIERAVLFVGWSVLVVLPLIVAGFNIRTIKRARRDDRYIKAIRGDVEYILTAYGIAAFVCGWNLLSDYIKNLLGIESIYDCMIVLFCAGFICSLGIFLSYPRKIGSR